MLVDDDTPTDLSAKCDDPPSRVICVSLMIPEGSELGAALIRHMKKLQAVEEKIAKAENRDPRTVTMQEVILRNCCTVQGLTFVRPKRK